MRTPTIHFVYADQYRETGSTVMRGAQLSELARRHLQMRARIRYSSTSSTFRNSTLFLTKGALKVLGAEQLAALKQRGNRLLFDVVDEAPPPTTREFADALVAASITAYVEYSRLFPQVQVSLVNHHVNPRITSDERLKHPRPSSSLKSGYVGELVNAILTPAILERVEAVHVDTSREHYEWLERLPDFNLHYAVRNTRALDAHKPFLKGFTAAYCRANVLIQADYVEALHWLGPDYPYLLHGPPTEERIIAALDHVASSFGSAEWHDALEVMAGLRERVSANRIVRELAAILR